MSARCAQPPSRHPRFGNVSAIAMPATLAPAAISTALPYTRVMSNGVPARIGGLTAARHQAM
jgi:hypothetical protein